MITLGLLKTEFASFMVNQTISSRIADWAYWTTVDILSSYDFWWNKRVGAITTVASQADYYLSHRVDGKQVEWMGDEGREGVEIKETDLKKIYRFDSTPTDVGDPEVWAYIDQRECQQDNAASTISVVSSSNSDQGMNLVIRGEVSGIERYEQVSLTGTTPAAGSLVWDAGSISSVSLSQSCVGVISVTCGSPTIASIPPGQLRVQCPRIKLWRVPGDVLTLPYIYYQNPMKMVLDGDIVDMPNAAMSALLKGVEYWGHKNNGDLDFARAALEEFKDAKDELRSWSTRNIAKIDVKNWRKSDSDVPFSLPRTIVATVT